MTYITTGARRVETFAGMFTHQPSGLYLTLFRAYDPYSGRWLSRDPTGEEGKDVVVPGAILNQIVASRSLPALQNGSLPSLPPTSTPQAADIVSISERVLSPSSGYFGDITGINLYAYVGENPIDRFDLDGEGWGQNLFNACMLCLQLAQHPFQAPKLPQPIKPPPPPIECPYKNEPPQ